MKITAKDRILCLCDGSVTVTLDVDVSRTERDWIALIEPSYLCGKNGARVYMPAPMTRRVRALALDMVAYRAREFSGFEHPLLRSRDVEADPCRIEITPDNRAVCLCGGGITVSLDVDMDNWAVVMDEFYSCRQGARGPVPHDMWNSLFAVAVATAATEDPDREGPWLVDMSWAGAVGG